MSSYKNSKLLTDRHTDNGNVIGTSSYGDPIQDEIREG